MKKAFTLMEVLIATLILALVGVGALSLITQSVSLVRESQDLLKATLLGENLASKDLLGILPEWKIEGEQEGFKWEKEVIPAQISNLEFHKYIISCGGRKIELFIVKSR